jgi:formiminoglutamase
MVAQVYEPFFFVEAVHFYDFPGKTIREMSQRSKYCLVGIPDHQGVLNVGGRVGAAEGPGAFRKAFARLHGRKEMHDLLRDMGDVQGLGGDVVVNHRLAAEAVGTAHHPSGISVVVGGGHDHGFSHLLGISQALAKGVSSKRGAQSKKLRLGCINIDAHLDVRKPAPSITSGSPFYLAIESGVLDPSRLVEFGVQSHCNRAELWDYAQKKKIGIVPFEKVRGGKAMAVFKQALTRLSARCDAIVISMDLDAASEAHAPGVSAPQCEGFTSSEMVQMAELAGQARKVVSLGIFELNPVHDVGDRTARLGAVAAWHFLEQAASR